MSRQTRINWDGFWKLRNDEGNIRAAECKRCETIIIIRCSERFENHRYIEKNE